MKKSIGCVFIACLATGIVCGQAYKGQLQFAKVVVPPAHYQEEYTFDTTLNVAAWNKEENGLQVSFASTDQLYFRSEVPDLEKETLALEGTVWKGERFNTQVLVWSPDTLSQVRFTFSDLKTDNGKTLPASNYIKANLVRYVVSNYPYAAKDVTCGASPYPNLYLMPDRFEPLDRFHLPGRSVRPVWISIDVPASASSGLYKGTVTVQSENFTKTLNVSLRVQNQLLPDPSQWKHRFDLWQNPWVVAWKNNLQPWSPEHMLLLKKHLKMYADAGGTFITTYAVHSPWSDNSYMIEGAMIDWLKKKDGGWKFDYKIFDSYVELGMSMGINEAITLYTPVPWGFRFRYMDEASGNYMYESWPPDSKAFADFWNIFLTDLKKHLEQKGWFQKTYLGINENEMQQTLAAIRVIKAHSKSWKITYAGDWHQELDLLLDDYCFLYGKESDVDVVRKRAARGQTTTYYVCCNPPVPNNFVFSPPAEGRWLGWYTTAHGYDGFLRWAYDAWPADPMRDARHELWPAGDCFIVYPGGNSCIRFEKLREGIVDFEKIRMLREKAKVVSDPSVRQLMQQLDAHLASLLNEKDFQPDKIRNDINKGKLLLEQLSEKLALRM